MSGYVCSLKPLKLARQGNTEAARAVIASSAFRRIIRLGMPAIFATTISWFLDQFGAFNTARSLPWNCWFHFFSPPEVPSFWAGLRELFRSFVRFPNCFEILICSFVPGITMASPGILREIGMKEFNGLLHTSYVVPSLSISPLSSPSALLHLTESCLFSPLSPIPFIATPIYFSIFLSFQVYFSQNFR